jgi:diguanylate cyclase (GGDEF)-like protein
MALQRLVRAGTPPEVSVLALMSLILGAGCLGLAAFPLSPDSPIGVIAAISATGLIGALALVLRGDRVAPIHLHAGMVLYTGLLGVMVGVAVTERGLMLSTLGFIWTAVYVAFFFAPRAARWHATFMVAVLGFSLLEARAPTDVSVWIAISTMVWVAVAILTRLNERLRTEAHVDNLTGLLNRTGFAFAATRQRAMAQRRGEPLALVVIDLDGFKEVNDQGGHAAGDRLLVELAGAWTASLRPSDVLARFGGDEFVLLLSGATQEQVDDLLARLGRAHAAPWTFGAVICSESETLSEAIDRADERLYVAKTPQRNRDAGAREAAAVAALEPDAA